MNSPGRAHRKGLTIIELAEMFPSEPAAAAWFESVLWPAGRCCGHCGSTRTSPVASRKPMPYWCSDCREYFSVKTGTAMQRSKVSLREVGHRHLPLSDEPQERVVDEAPPRHRRLAEDGLVHAAPYP